jgi:hypothetical protein
MRYLTVTLLVMISAATSVALAQDGGVHGPPKSSPIIVLPQPTTPPLPWPGVPLPQFSQPAAELPSTEK